jgi:hypothetical protein
VSSAAFAGWALATIFAGVLTERAFRDGRAGAAAFPGMMVGVSFTVMCFVAGMR